MIKLLLWLLLGRKFAEPFLHIVEQQKDKPHQRVRTTGMLRRALFREPTDINIPLWPVRPYKKAPTHKNEGSRGTRQRAQCQFGPIPPPVPGAVVPYGSSARIAGVYPGEDDDAEDQALDAEILRQAIAAHYADPCHRFGVNCERDY